MSYAAAVDQLNAMVPELFQAAGGVRRKFSLDEIGVLLAALGDPHRKFPSVLIAGTNGKGSTAATLASILTAAGLNTGLYTSPHLVRANERMRLNHAEIDDDTFARHYFRVHDAAQELVARGALAQPPSYFEVLTAQAFLYFAESRVDIAVLEVGMGGRLDATNIVDPLLSVITDIALDHTEWLGSTITAIAREKAGILRRDGTLVTLPQHPEANQALGEVAVELNVRGVNAAPYMPVSGVPGVAASGFGAADGSAYPVSVYPVSVLGEAILVGSPLKGAHQHRNIALAIAAAAELATHHGFAIQASNIAAGIRNTRWPGRLERITASGVEWVLDVAHNPAGAWALRSGLNASLSDAAGPKILVFSCLNDKPVTEMAQILFPLFDRVILAPIRSARAAGMEELLAAARLTGTPAEAAESVGEALKLAAEQAGGGLAVVSGSVYLVGEARSILMREGEGEGWLGEPDVSVAPEGRRSS
jgi:dihydrofolate synthase/folylpolyglutamate synthase